MGQDCNRFLGIESQTRQRKVSILALFLFTDDGEKLIINVCDGSVSQTEGVVKAREAGQIKINRDRR